MRWGLGVSATGKSHICPSDKLPGDIAAAVARQGAQPETRWPQSRLPVSGRQGCPGAPDPHPAFSCSTCLQHLVNLSSGSRDKKATPRQSEAQAVTFVIQVLPFPRRGLNRLILKRRDKEAHVHRGPPNAGVEAAGLRASLVLGPPGGRVLESEVSWMQASLPLRVGQQCCESQGAQL